MKNQIFIKFMRAPAYVFLTLAAIISIFPLLYTFTNSLMGAAEISKYYGNLAEKTGNPFHLIPDRITLEGYYKMLISRPDYLMKFWISLGLATTVVAGQLIISTLGGYAFAKFCFPGRDIIFFIIIIVMMMPYQVTLVPNYIVLSEMKLIGSYLSIVLPGFFSAFGIFLMTQSISAISDAILEAAGMDGAGSFRALLNIIIPNCKSGLASLAVLNFIDNWNMVEQPLVFLKDKYKYPLSVFLTYINEFEPTLGFACGVLSILPALYLFIFYEREMVSGIGYSVVK